MTDRDPATRDPEDPSVRCLDVLRSSPLDPNVRASTFAELLGLPRGWWGEKPLLEHASIVSWAMAQRMTRRFGWPEDVLDWEGAADDAVLALAEGAVQIASSPSGWLHAVIKNKLRHQIDERMRELQTEPLEQRAIGLKAAVPAMSAQDAAPAAPETPLERAVRALPSSLRAVAELLLIERRAPEDIRTILGISAPTFRKRRQRMNELLRKASPATGDGVTGKST